MRLLIAQYAGDYREAFYNLAEGKGETYYAQQYSFVAVPIAAAQVDEIAPLEGRADLFAGEKPCNLHSYV